MNPLLRMISLPWIWDPYALALILLAAGLYGRGWLRLRWRRRGTEVRANRQLVAYVSGLIFLAVALFSPIDMLGTFLFFAHMLQHLLLIMVVPPLLLMANPFPYVLWGGPAVLRRLAADHLHQKASFRQFVRRLTTPGVTWLTFVVVFLIWHDPNAYNAALTYEWAHIAEHLTFFGAGLLYWWPLSGAGPRLHKPLPLGLQSAYLLMTIPITMFVGIGITFSTQPIYSYYEMVPHPWGYTVMEDQIIAGFLMWVPGSMMILVAFLTILANHFRLQERRRHSHQTPVLSSEGLASS